MPWAGPGFVDHHTHLLRVGAGVPPPWRDVGLDVFHRSIAARGSTPMDEPPPPVGSGVDLPARLGDALAGAAARGLVEVWECGLGDWAELDALLRLREAGPLPVRVRILVASALATPGMRRTGDAWVEVEGVKLYADGWLGPRTCACSRPFADTGDDGVLFLDADAVARRAAPFADAGWLVATHAIGDRAIEAVLEGYERAFGGDAAALRAAGWRIEHAQLLRADLIDRMASLGVVACIQPSFAVSDAAAVPLALGSAFPDAYRWDRLLDAGVPVVAGSDFPIETLDPLIGLQELVTGARDGGPPVAPSLDLERALAVMTSAAAGTTHLDADPRDVDPRGLSQLRVVGVEPAPLR